MLRILTGTQMGFFGRLPLTEEFIDALSVVRDAPAPRQNADVLDTTKAVPALAPPGAFG
jgi:hypothetical protein